MLQPKQTKYRKYHRGKMKGLSSKASTLDNGDYGLKAVGPGWVTARQIESARRAITGYLKRGGQVWIRVFPDKPITKKPLEVRQGKGKGNVEYWVCPVKPGKILYEMEGVDEELAREAFKLAAAKISVATSFVRRI